MEFSKAVFSFVFSLSTIIKKKMKRSIVVIALVLLGVQVNVMAQVSAGRIFLGGNLGFNSSGGKTTVKTSSTTVETKAPNVSSFSIGLGGGYLISDKLGVGLNFGFNSSTTKEDSTDYSYKETSSSFFVSPFLRYYLMLEDNFGFTGTFSVGISSGSSKDELKTGGTTVTNEGPKLSSLSVGITPGVIFFPSSKVGLEANIGFLGYSSNTSKTTQTNPDITTTTTRGSFGLNVSSFTPIFNVGFYYYLGGE